MAAKPVPNKALEATPESLTKRVSIDIFSESTKTVPMLTTLIAVMAAANTAHPPIGPRRGFPLLNSALYS